MELSIAILMFNEAENIEEILDDTLAFCKGSLEKYEILVVDDGSTDGSGDIVQKSAVTKPCIRLLTHRENQGMGAGIRTAIQHATYSYFTFNAADGQIAAEEIGRLTALLSQSDIALSSYRDRGDLIRSILSRCFRAYLKHIVRLPFELEGLYIVPTSIAKELAGNIDARTFFFSFALIENCLERGLTWSSCEISCRPRMSGKSKVLTLRRILEVGMESLRFAAAHRVRRKG